MKRPVVCITLFTAFVLIGTAFAGKDKEGAQLRVELDLTDGSRLIGVPKVTSFRLAGSFGKIELPIDQVSNIKFNADHETAVLRLINNDRLSGAIDLSDLDLKTLFGSVVVPLKECRSIAVLAGGFDDGLVVYYTFDAEEDSQRIRDQSGGGNDSVWVGAPQYGEGVKGKAARFSSKDTYLVASSPELNMNGWNGMTVSLWVSATAHTTYGHVINRGPLSTDKPGAFELAIGQSYGKGIFVLQNSPTSFCPTIIAGPGNLPLNRWCHIAGTYDGEMLRYYIDGKLEKETRIAVSKTPVLDGPDTKLVIGNMSRIPFINWSDMFFNGLVDEVRIYRRALSEEEISHLSEMPK